MQITDIVSKMLGLVRGNQLFVFFMVTHSMLAVFLGRLYALAPDEVGYLYTFNKIYSLPIGTSAQSGSGWITAPTIFLWIAYLPAKILNMIGIPDYLSIRILSILLTWISLFLLLEMLRKSQLIQKFFFLKTFELIDFSGAFPKVKRG